MHTASADDIKNMKDELPRYEQASSIYEQIFSLHEFVMKLCERFLLTTGAVWVAVTSNQLSLPREVRVGLCLLIAVAGVQILIVNYGALRSIRARFVMVDELGTHLFPTILKVGRGGFDRDDPKWATWGKNRKDFFWYFIPLIGIVGSAILAVSVLVGSLK